VTDARRQPPRAVLPRAADRLTLNGKLKVSPLCLGAVADPRAIPHAFDLGINFFFLTADMHWPLYQASRRGLAALLSRKPSVRERVVVAVVSYVAQPEFSYRPFEEALAAVPGLDRIDVTVAGGSRRGDFSSRARQFALHGPLGVRAFAASFHERRLAARAVRDELVDIGFVRYNTEHRGAERDVFPHVGRRGSRRRALLYNFTSTAGHLSPERYAELGLSRDHWRPAITDHYRFALERPELDGLLCGPRTPRELDALERALAQGPLSDEESRYLRGLSDLAVGKASLA
jgi:hypothetical protein